MNTAGQKHVLVMVNPKSGLWWSFDMMRRAIDEAWDNPETDLCYQFCQNAEDGVNKAVRAVARGVETVLVVGGDGTISTIGRALLDTGVCLGAVPAGSGNGFARHFGIPLSPDKAVRALATARVQRIDVGMIDETPFFVTCSMAWDAAIVKSFAKSPVRGIVPYVLAGVHELFEYEPQDIWVALDGRPERRLPSPMVFTIANLSQYGGGARIAPRARADDGCLELVVALRQDVPKLIARVHRLFDGSADTIPELISERFKSMTIRRERAAPIQIDGELVDAGRDLRVRVVPAALNVLVP